MKVLHLATTVAGGAGIAAGRIHHGVRSLGLESRLLSRDDFSQSAGAPAEFIQRLKRRWFINGRPPGLELFSPAGIPQTLVYGDLPVRPDVLHLHWIAGLFDYRRFFNSLPEKLPVVWTLHDFNPMTGGCHYPRGCSRYQQACGQCPQIAHPSRVDWSAQTHRDKRRSLPTHRLHVVSAGAWVVEAARKSSLLAPAASFSVITTGLDTQDFLPQERGTCREALGISPGSKVVCFGADYTENNRKGLNELMQALRQLNSRVDDVLLLVFGRKPGGLAESGIPHRFAGYLDTPEALSQVYSAADVFVMPSLHEVFGQVALEAMACKTPVVAFDNGSISDLVRHGETGYLARHTDADDLAVQIEKLLSDKAQCRLMGEQAREVVVAEFNSQRQARDYVDLYNRVLDSSE